MRVPGCGGAAVVMVMFCSACFEDAGDADCVGDACVSSSGASSSGATTTIDPTTSGSSSDGGTSQNSSDTSTGADTTTDATIDPASSSGSEGPQPSCGDRRVMGAEECDDGNDAPYDGCDACQVAPALMWQFAQDHEGGDDEVTSLARDGEGALVGGVVADGVSADDAVWLRVADGGIAPPAWFHIADLPENNRLWDVARGPDACVIAGFITPDAAPARLAANFVDCADGQPGAGIPFTADPAGDEEIRGMVVRANGTLVVAGFRIQDAATRGWIAELDATGTIVANTTWLDDVGLFGDESRVVDLWLAPDGVAFVAGTSIDGGVSRGFAGSIDTVAGDPIVFAPAALASEAAGVVAIPEGIVVAGWTEDREGQRVALVEAYPQGGGPPATWSFGMGADDRALAVAVDDGGVAVTGFTTTMASDRDLFVAWLDPQLGERHRVVYDGPAHGADVGRDILADDTGVLVGGHTTVDDSTDLLVQRWQRPN